MKLPPFELKRPQSLDEALALRSSLGTDGKIVAGGQSLLPMMRYRMAQPYALIDISRLPELRSISVAAGVRIGASVTHADIERSLEAMPVFDLLRAHAAEIAFLPVRNKGTVVGSLVHADPAADWPMLFCALGAAMELRSLRGKRHVPVIDFIRGPMDTDVAVDEIATEVSLPADSADIATWGRCKLMHRVGEYATASAVAIRYQSGRWSCWSSAIDPVPLSLVECAQSLEASSDVALARLKVIVVNEIVQARPDCDALAVERHATAMVRAVKAANQRKPA